MEQVTGQMPGGILQENAEVSGQVTGDLTVPADRVLVLLGQITGGLTIEQGGKALVHGMVVGPTVNRGRLELWGTLVGGLDDVSEDSFIDVTSSVGES